MVDLVNTPLNENLKDFVHLSQVSIIGPNICVCVGVCVPIYMYVYVHTCMHETSVQLVCGCVHGCISNPASADAGRQYLPGGRGAPSPTGKPGKPPGEAPNNHLRWSVSFAGHLVSRSLV